jgi:hypothetical protein
LIDGADLLIGVDEGAVLLDHVGGGFAEVDEVDVDGVAVGELAVFAAQAAHI